MELNTNTHKLPNKASKSVWLDTMVANVQSEIQGYIEVGFTPKQAIERVKLESCAGHKVWEIIEAMYN